MFALCKCLRATVKSQHNDHNGMQQKYIGSDIKMNFKADVRITPYRKWSKYSNNAGGSLQDLEEEMETKMRTKAIIWHSSSVHLGVWIV